MLSYSVYRTGTSQSESDRNDDATRGYELICALKLNRATFFSIPGERHLYYNITKLKEIILPQSPPSNSVAVEQLQKHISIMRSFSNVMTSTYTLTKELKLKLHACITSHLSGQALY